MLQIANDLTLRVAIPRGRNDRGADGHDVFGIATQSPKGRFSGGSGCRKFAGMTAKRQMTYSTNFSSRSTSPHFIHRGKSTTDCRPRGEPRSERAQERKAAPTRSSLGSKLALLPACTLHCLSLPASSSHRPIARDQRGSLLGHSSVNKSD
jgi:hypothetical protein